MNIPNKKKRQAIKQIGSLAEYTAYRNTLKLTAEEKQIFDMVFLDGHNYNYIADTLGYSERTIKSKVKRILNRL
jgi:DNA-binding NarL/FixJ family response regulator